MSYLTIPNNFDIEQYYRFSIINNIIQEFLTTSTKKEITILDVGCGDCQFLKFVKDNAPENLKIIPIGLDLYIESNPYGYIQLKDDVEKKINLEDKSVDIIIAGEIIEHIRYTDSFVSEIKRILTDEGVAIISTPNLASYFNRLLLLFGNQPYHSEVSENDSGFGQGLVYAVLGRPRFGNKTAGHLRLFTHSCFVDFITFYGFDVSKYYPIHFSSYREDNKRKILIKLFFWIDKKISNLFPKLASGMVFLIRKSKTQS